MSNLQDLSWSVTERPRWLDSVYGQDAAVKLLTNCLKNKTLGKAVFFLADFGLGKTTLAKIIAKSLACHKTDSNGVPCHVCPSCLAIDNESWDRDCIYINGGHASAQEVRNTIDNFVSTSAFRDKSKVMIIDETQKLSPEAVQAFLNAAESPTKGQTFIFTAMTKPKGVAFDALVSRCKMIKLQKPTLEKVYLYLVNFAIRKGLVDKAGKSIDKKIPDEFWTPQGAIQLIIENSEYSYRKAIQLLQSAIDGELYTREELSETLDFGSYDEMIKTVEKLANGVVDEVVLDTIVGTKYQEDFNLIFHILGNCEVVRVLGKLSNDERDKWKATQPKVISKAPHYAEVRDTFIELSRLNNGFLRKGDWTILMSQLIEKIRGTNEQEEPKRRTTRRTV